MRSAKRCAPASRSWSATCRSGATKRRFGQAAPGGPEIAQALNDAAIFLAIISRTYLDSDECRKELDTFLGRLKDASTGTQRMIVPIFKQPPKPDQELPREVGDVHRHEFFRWDPPGSPRFRELGPDPDGADTRAFWETLGRVAQDIMVALEALRGAARTRALGTVFVARVGPEIQLERERLRSDLQQRGYLVVPEHEYLWNADDFRARIDADLDAARLCIHLVAKTESIEPETAERAQLQLKLAHEAMKRSARPAPLVWIQPASAVDPSARALIDYIEGDLANDGVEYWRGGLEDLKTQIYDKLGPAAPAPAASPAAGRAVAMLVEEGGPRERGRVALAARGPPRRRPAARQVHRLGAQGCGATCADAGRVQPVSAGLGDAARGVGARRPRQRGARGSPRPGPDVRLRDGAPDTGESHLSDHPGAHDPGDRGSRRVRAARLSRRGSGCAMTQDELLALNPYPGLRAFAVSEADLFFGRQRQVDELVERLHASTLVAVAGASGCGKSSLVLAGLLHELARRHVEKGGIEWRPVVMRPGNHPISNLASALAAALDGAAAVDPTRAAALDGRLRLSGIGLVEAVRLAHLPPRVRVVVVVDQFEEIFRFRRMTDQDESAAFVKLLLHAAFDPESPVSVVLTLRSDTLGYCADFRDLPEAISRGQYLVPRLTRDQRKNAIVGPVELRGFRVAPRLVQRVLNDVSDDFDDLPVMQHALSRTWRRWATACAGSRPIDVEDYEAIGAAANALSMHADEAYDALTGQGAVVEKVFRALTERVAEGTEVRRPLQFGQLCAVTGCDRTAVAQVVERYRQGDTVFLLPAAAVPLAGNPVIDISHESLIRNWKRLKQWTDRETQSAQMIRRLFDAAERYATQTEGLLRDPALQFALDWRERNQPTAAWAALYGSQFERTMQFLDDSRDARDRERLAARRAARRRRWTVGLALVGSLIFGAVMAWQYCDSAAARREAEDARSRSLSRQLALLANSELSAGRLDRALLLGVAAMRQPTEEAQDILRVALQSAPRRFLSGHRDEVSSVAFAPDGKSLASASQDGDGDLLGPGHRQGHRRVPSRFRATQPPDWTRSSRSAATARCSRRRARTEPPSCGVRRTSRSESS